MLFEGSEIALVRFLICFLPALLDQFEGRPSSLFDLELSVRLADDPPVVKLPAWSDPSEARQEIILAAVDATPVVANLVHAGVLENIRDLQIFDFVPRVLFRRQVVFIHY